ncbi:hypothetical protein SRABI02_00845 [Plantibacter cousiniae]|nr:hypothetical protein SRABI02_00845 [Plantibacter cousiniae]
MLHGAEFVQDPEDRFVVHVLELFRDTGAGADRVERALPDRIEPGRGGGEWVRCGAGHGSIQTRTTDIRTVTESAADQPIYPTIDTSSGSPSTGSETGDDASAEPAEVRWGRLLEGPSTSSGTGGGAVAESVEVRWGRLFVGPSTSSGNGGDAVAESVVVRWGRLFGAPFDKLRHRVPAVPACGGGGCSGALRQAQGTSLRGCRGVVQKGRAAGPHAKTK